MNNYAFILAAGIGSRLTPITNYLPKSLVKVNGKEIIDYQIKGYLNAGIKEENIFVVTGYMSDKIEEFLSKYYPNVRVIESVDYKNTNNMFSLFLALKTLKEMTSFNIDTLFINNADCLYDENLILEFANSPLKNAIATEIGSFIGESMKIVVDKNIVITDIAKTIKKDLSYGVSVDLYKYNHDAVKILYEIIFEYIEIRKDLKQWTEVAFPQLFKKINVFPYDIKNKLWVEVDNNEDLLIADKLFSDFCYKSKKAYICDLDGTLFIGNTPIQPAVDFIKRHINDFDFFFLTNNTSKTPANYVEKLTKVGINVKEEQIITPLYSLIDYIHHMSFKSLYLVANKDVEKFLKDNLNNVELSFNINNNQAVVLTYDTEISYEKLKNISVLLNNKKVEYITTHRDIFCPTELGPIPDIGSIINLIKVTNGYEPDVILGKPSVKIIQKQIESYNLENIAIVGDRLYTDKQLADNAGCDFVCVLSGETTRLDVALYEFSFPSIVVEDFGCLE